jgi:hypothetical protein
MRELKCVINLSVEWLVSVPISGDVIIPFLSLEHFKRTLLHTLLGYFIYVIEAILRIYSAVNKQFEKLNCKGTKIFSWSCRPHFGGFLCQPQVRRDLCVYEERRQGLDLSLIRTRSG